MRKLADTCDRSLYQGRILSQPVPRYNDDPFERFINLRRERSKVEKHSFFIVINNYKAIVNEKDQPEACSGCSLDYNPKNEACLECFQKRRQP